MTLTDRFYVSRIRRVCIRGEYIFLTDKNRKSLIPLIFAEVFSASLIRSMQTAVFSVTKGAERSFWQVTLCTVLSNLLDNAVEAAAKTDTKRVVTLSAKKAGSFYYICISNPTLNHIDVSADIPTSKPESSGHGLGLKSVRKAIEKCGGTLELSCKETSSSYTFIAEVILSAK